MTFNFQSLSSFETLLRSASDSIVIADGKGRIVWANEKAEKMPGDPARLSLKAEPRDVVDVHSTVSKQVSEESPPPKVRVSAGDRARLPC